MAKKLTGIVRVLSDGISLRVKDGASIEFGGFEREAQYADGQVAGFTEKPIASKITCTIVHDSSTDLIKLRDMVDVTFTFATDTGVNYVMNHGFASVPPKLTGGAGEVEVEFMGDPII